jgi:hypothetical protein
MRFTIALAAAHTGSVQLSSQTAAESLADVRLGQLLADQLQVAPKVGSAQEAKQVHALSGAKLFEKPQAVLVSVLDGANAEGTALESDCESRTECVQQVCYHTKAHCVLEQLVSQTDAQLPLPQLAAQAGGVTALSSDKHLAAFGYGMPHLAAHDLVAKSAIYGLSTNQQPPAFDLNDLAAHVQELTALADKVEHRGSALHMHQGEHAARLDLGNACVKTVLGEALAIQRVQKQDGQQLYLLAPRGVACMRKDFGHRSTEAMVAQKLLERAVHGAEHRLGAWSMHLKLPSPDQGADAQVMPLALTQARRLSVAADKALGVENAAIADYHIFLWVSITIVLSLYAAVYAITGMTGSRDPLLYAKFRPDVDPSARR